MARPKKEYVSKAVTTTIKASSRASIKVGDNFYTIEWTEERTVPEDCDIEKERTFLWETVNGEVDGQIQDILDAYGSKRR
jgi:hypothetical protein